jgi:hypothetical protein
MNKFKRIKFLKSFDIDGVIEQDLLYNYWDLFEIKRPLQYFTLSRAFIGRPDLLSIQVYGNQKYWWLLLKYNNIDDIWNDMEVGDIISIPDVNDLDDFLLKVVAKQKAE